MRRSQIKGICIIATALAAVCMIAFYMQSHAGTTSSALANPLAKTYFAGAANQDAAASKTAELLAPGVPAALPAAVAVPASGGNAAASAEAANAAAAAANAAAAKAAAAAQAASAAVAGLSSANGAAVAPASGRYKPRALIPIKPRLPRKPLPESIMAKVREEAVVLEQVRDKIQSILARMHNPEPLPPTWKKLKRRAAVMYIDRGGATTFREQLDWWIYAWRAIGLDSPAAAFDIVVFVDPESAHVLSPECEHLPPNPGENLVIEDDAPGKCFYEYLVGIHDRSNKAYDNYMNSMECVYNPVAKFLLRYESLLRTDIDTFPTPRLNQLYPKTTLCSVRPHGYTFGQAKQELYRTAEAIGFDHQHWHEMASSWFGPSQQVVTLAELTVESGVFIKNFLFGSGSNCKVPDEYKDNDYPCAWGSGVYEGVLLLYSQEFALNMVWTPEDYRESIKMGWQFDLGTTFAASSVCGAFHLHIHHGEDMFSKFMFHMHKYDKEDLTNVDVTMIPGYSFFMAMNGNKRGTNTLMPITKLRGPLRDLCKTTFETGRPSFMISRSSDGACLTAVGTEDGQLYWGDCNAFDNRQLFYNEEMQIRQGKWRCLRQTEHIGSAPKEVGSMACTMWLDRGAGDQNWNFSPMGHMIAAHSSSCLTVSSEELDTPLYLKLEACRFNDTRQQFRFLDPTALRQGFKLPALEQEKLVKVVDKSALCLGWRADSLQAVTTLPCNEVEGLQAWVMRDNGQLTNVLSNGARTGLCLGQASGRVLVPCMTNLPAALWEKTASNTLVNKATKQCLHSNGASVSLTVADCSAAHVWQLNPTTLNSVTDNTKVGSKLPEASLVQIIQDETRCLDRFGAQAIYSYGCQVGSTNQLWARIGPYHLASVEKSGTSGLYEVQNNCLTLSEPISITACDMNNVKQKWQLERGLFYSLQTPSVCLLRDDKNLVKSGECVMSITSLFGMRHPGLMGSYIEKPGWMAFGHDTRMQTQTTAHIAKALASRRRALSAAAAATASSTGLSHAGNSGSSHSGRRAIVLYIGADARPAQVSLWLFAWEHAGLKDAGVDLVFFAAPTNSILVPDDCLPVREGLDMSPSAEGRCLRRVLRKLAHRKRHHFVELEEIEFLVSGADSEFLKGFSHLLRADLASVPTPMLQSSVPVSLQMNIGGTPASLGPEAQKVVAKEAERLGLRHQGVWAAGQTWYGPSAEVMEFAHLSVLVARGLQYSLFGVASICSAPVNLRTAAAGYCGAPEERARTIVRTAVALAANELLSGEQVATGRTLGSKLEGSTVSGSTCDNLLLRPGEQAGTEVFNGLAFLLGQYNERTADVGQLGKASEYTLYMAVNSMKNPPRAKRPAEKLCKM